MIFHIFILHKVKKNYLIKTKILNRVKFLGRIEKYPLSNFMSKNFIEKIKIQMYHSSKIIYNIKHRLIKTNIIYTFLFFLNKIKIVKYLYRNQA